MACDEGPATGAGDVLAVAIAQFSALLCAFAVAAAAVAAEDEFGLMALDELGGEIVVSARKVRQEQADMWA